MKIDEFIDMIRKTFGKYNKAANKRENYPPGMANAIRKHLSHLEPEVMKKLFDAVCFDYNIKSRMPYIKDIYIIAENNSILLAKPERKTTLVYYCGECKNQIDVTDRICTICKKPVNDLARTCSKCGFTFIDKKIEGKKIDGQMVQTTIWNVRMNCPECTTKNKAGVDKATYRHKYYIVRKT